ncbi:autotransporter outer membrane beta-barrel domain-containing protein [Sporosarcina gallistercoris]|uniref:Uncharacterized protein n=1 Tax=Sporosarcina gallistercoris TaxID=2762245 RepID=A0ABR8PFR3_9BACL|nr:hypothetical protein [Sporosarcina gallistercoris]MBD7907009.1 hypothetical protein [Sporosarcina gallistercoris]VDG98662.1 Uncharacterised protein [Lysinibacillus sphaericus]
MNTAGTYSGIYEVTSNSTYGPATSTTLNGNLYVNSDATLKNLVINGTVYVNPGANGTVTLNNVTATNIVVLSGATNSIHLNNVTADNLTVKNDDSVRIESNSGTAIANTVVQSGAILDANGGSFGTIELTPTSSESIELRGNLTGSAINVTKPNVVLNVAAGAVVGTLTIDAAATGTTVDNAGTISNVTANAPVDVTGNAPTTSTGNVQTGQSEELKNKTVTGIALSGEKLAITFSDDVDTTNITNAESFLNEYLQFQVTRVYRADGAIKKDNGTPATQAEAKDLTASEVKTVLGKVKDTTPESGWSTAIDWSKVKFSNDTDKNVVLLTVENDLISASDLIDPAKINSGNAKDPLKGYKITVYKKGDTSTRYKLQLNTINPFVVTTTKFIKE